MKRLAGVAMGLAAAAWSLLPVGANAAIACAVNPLWITPIGPYLVFQATNTASSREVWRTDGTSAGTKLVADIDPGPGSFAGSLPEEFTKAGNRLLFRAGDPTHSWELWRTDGTAAGTRLVRDIWPGGTYASIPEHFVVLNNVAYFVAEDGVNGREVWRSDGTSAGTKMLGPFDPYTSDDEFGPGGPDELAVVNGKLFFAIYVPEYGVELWTSDGTTAGTHVLDVIPGPGSISPRNLTQVGSILYFGANRGGIPNDTELWRSDGTLAGTYMVRDINPTGASLPKSLTAVQGRLFFSATTSPTQGDQEPWMSDGTWAGTRPIKDIYPGPESSFIADPVALPGGVVVFNADDGAHGREIWRSDLTSAGTYMLKDTPSTFWSSAVERVGALGWYWADHAVWKTNGTRAGTVRVSTKTRADGRGVGAFRALNGLTYFSNRLEVETVAHLWVTDGTNAGTRRVQPVCAD